MAALDAIKKVRIAGLMLRRNWEKHTPWPNYPKEGEVDLTGMSRKAKEVIRPLACATSGPSRRSGTAVSRRRLTRNGPPGN
jgi:hypothetical protein